MTGQPGRMAHVPVPAARDAGPRPVGSRPRPQADDGDRLADPTALCCAVVQAAIEVIDGLRSATQLVRWVTPEVLEQLRTRAELTVPTLRRPPGATRVRRVRLDRVSARCAEASVVVQDGQRVRAAAVRAEVLHGRWRLTVLELG